ncbi:MAG: 3-hydroxyacyl-CoA dehydrogenase family protein [Candidatus Thermoplasmatota archaeon]|nr:3-hydroxyacyl-CoA dehydrogenase family protein [Candidatus Thermoplasmatota archaeon]
MKVAVIGAGTMGRGIAQVFAQSSHSVLLADMVPEALPRARKAIGESLERLSRKGSIKESAETVLGRIRTIERVEDLKGCDIYLEAVFERADVKLDLFRKLNSIAGEGAIMATNTSSISVNLLSGAVDEPGNFIGMHFFNPVPVMKLVEIVKAEKTFPETVERVTSISKELGKEPVVSKDFPGFISNRILMPLLREAMVCYQEGVASAEDIDKTAKLGFNHPMGPLELSDFIGLDVVRDIMEVLYYEFGEERFKPPIVLRNMVNSGLLGRKSGSGFYRYGGSV